MSAEAFRARRGRPGIGGMLALGMLAACVAGCATSPELGAMTAGSKADGGARADKSQGLARLAGDVEQQGETDTALTLYQQAVTASGNSPAAYVRLGDACIRANEVTRAVAAYRAALAEDSDNVDASLGLGAALVQQGDLQNGLVALAGAAPRANTGTAYNRLGVAQTMAGQFGEAQDSFGKGRMLAPDDLDIATNLALATALAGEGDKAEALAREIAQSPAAEPRHRRNLVIVLGLVGRSNDEARAVAPTDMSPREIAALLKHAGTIRAMSDPKARAKALGTMRS